MAAADLNAGARPYHRRRSNRPHHHLSPLQPPPPVMPPAYYYGGAAYQPPPRLVPNYSRATFPEHHYRLPQQAPFFRNHAPSPPRALTFPNNRGGFVCEKLYAQAMYRYNKSRAFTAMDGRRGAARGPRAWTRGRGLGRAHVPVARAGGRAARSPSPALTTRPESWVPRTPAWYGCTTVMIRNIPNNLTRAAMVELLDDHCARENRRRRGQPAAYDFLYLPMDFRDQSSNRGYAFVNFTTADAAFGLYYALHGCGWKLWVGGRRSRNINVAAAHIQGKRAVVRRFARSTFVCPTDEFRPAVFWPPRDGATDSQPRHLGRRLPPLVSAVDQSQPLAVAPPQQQQPVRVEACYSMSY
uniref:Uncharacterized protein n=1 Tax=Avena sativa TaxID=4498 RepID=A0ACD5YP48_AVESA